ncbi:MAG: GIY-YIG nuclease family protein [Slackia sp.]|nr:GIY-YIG nuclease family protein [Slackia sp.]
MINLKTITLQLIDGEPNGIKLCRLAGSTLMTIVIPRALLSRAKKLPEIPKRGVYYLLDDNKGCLRRVYAGQTVQGISRLDDHHAKKDWWNTAVMHLSPDSEFSLDVVSGLEKRMISYIADHGSYASENSVIPKPFVSPYTEAFIANLHEDILFRMGVLGFDLGAVDDVESVPPTRPSGALEADFDAIGDDAADDGMVFHTTCRGIEARGRYDSGTGKFTVLAGSQVDVAMLCGSREKVNTGLESRRDSLRDEGLLVLEDGVWRVVCDVDFSTPSAAATFVLGASQNGWTEWVSESGDTLSSVYRGK